MQWANFQTGYKSSTREGRQHASPKRRCMSSKLRSVVSHKAVIFLKKTNFTKQNNEHSYP